MTDWFSGAATVRAAVVLIPAAVALLSLVFAFAATGSPDPSTAALRFAFVIETLLTAGGVVGVWMLSAMGWGGLWAPLVRDAAHERWLRFACGVATSLWLAHAVGAAAILAHRPMAWAMLVGGVVLLAVPPRSGALRIPRLSPVTLLSTPAIAVMLVAAASLPGWLWESESYGYDVLEYHLQLPKEWLASGRLGGLEHNVFSFLPGYVEAVYLQIGALAGDLLVGAGILLRAAQLLQAALAVAGALMLGALAAGRAREALGEIQDRHVAGFVVCVVLLVPWVQVVGSLAYNDVAVVFFFAAALMAVRGVRSRPWAAAFLAGWLVGVATGAKLTSVLLLGLPVFAALVHECAAGERVRSVVWAALGGILALGPWLLRNLVDTGNPLFPFGTEVFGLAHWSSEQLARWQDAHGFDGDAAARVRAAGGAILHPQYSTFFGLVAVGVAAGLWKGARLRREVTLFAGLLVLLLAGWATATHLHPRFLLPAIAPGAVLVGLVAARILGPRSDVPAVRLAAMSVALVPMIAASVGNFRVQRGGDPSAFVSPGAFAVRTGQAFAGDPELENVAPLSYHINFELPEGSLVYLLGDARALYLLAPVLYHTAFDRSPLGELMRAHPGDPAAWAEGLAGLGVTHVLVSYAELDRLQRQRLYDPLVTKEVADLILGSFGREVARTGALSALFELRSPSARFEPGR